MGPGGGLLIVAHLNPKKRGSLERQLSALAARAGAAGIPVRLIVARPPAPSVARELAAAGASFCTVDFAHPLAAAARVAAIAHRERPSLAHLHFLRPISPIAHAARAFARRLVLNDHLALAAEPSATRAAKRAVLRLAGAHADVRVAVSAHVAASLTDAEAVPPERIRVIANGIDLARFAQGERSATRESLGLAAREPVIACIARMAPEKGVDVAIRAMARLGAPATLLVAGDGPDRDACEHLARSLGLRVDGNGNGNGNVRFLGLRDDIEHLLAAADQVWVPSRAEAFGLAAAEAMAAGRPVIASRAGGLPEIITDNATGRIVPPAHPAPLAAAARSLLDDPSRSAALATRARARAAVLYPLDRQLDQLAHLYHQLVPAWSGLVA
jgi:glycosyltransferase involved in cell wall biosynthesis